MNYKGFREIVMDEEDLADFYQMKNKFICEMFTNEYLNQT